MSRKAILIVDLNPDVSISRRHSFSQARMSWQFREIRVLICSLITVSLGSIAIYTGDWLGWVLIVGGCLGVLAILGSLGRY